MAQASRAKRLVTAGTTFSVALTIGYVMQYGDADASRFTVEGIQTSNSTPILPLDASPLQPAVEIASKVPADVQRVDVLERPMRVGSENLKLTALVAEAANSSIFRTIDVSAAGKRNGASGCDVGLRSTAGPDASVLLSVDSPCRVSMPFEVNHSGMTFTGVTDAGGQATVNVPALEVNASIFVNFSDGSGAAVTALVPEADNFNRVVLQWKGMPAEYIQIAEESFTVGGDLQRFGFDTGEASWFAEVYSFPANYSVGKGLQELTVKAAVSSESCGQELNAQSFNVFPGASPAFKDIRITLPECDQVGTFLELKKVLGGQTLLP